MKITQELLKKCLPCADAYRWTLDIKASLNKDEITYEEGMEFLLQNNVPQDWILWYKSLPSNPIAVSFYNDHTYLEEYRVNDLAGGFDFASSYQDALNLYEEYKNVLHLHNPGLFNCRAFILDEYGFETTIKVDLNNTDITENIFVFNPLSGQYSEPLSLDEAKKASSEIKEQYYKNMTFGVPIYQKIQNPDGDTAWVPYEERS